jgi:hypothetical protein
LTTRSARYSTRSTSSARRTNTRGRTVHVSSIARKAEDELEEVGTEELEVMSRDELLE